MSRRYPRTQFDEWAGKVAAKLLDKAQQAISSKLSEKMIDAYKMGRRDERNQIAAYLDAYGDLGAAIRNLAHRADGDEPMEPPCCEHAKDYCKHGASVYQQCAVCIDECAGQRVA